MRTFLWRNALVLSTALVLGLPVGSALASSHREAPLISYDPLADNTDVYAFRSPDNPNTVTIIADYIPFELAEGGPNYYSFGEGVRYEIHIDNNAAKKGDEIIYRFTFSKVNEDPTTFFNIRLGKQNLKTTYVCEKSTDGGATFTQILTNGVVPPPNIGPRSIEGAAGLNTTYETLMSNAIATASGTGSAGEKIFCGPVDDPFYVDLGGIFDLGQTRKKDGVGADKARDGLAGFNCHAIALQIPIEELQKDHKPVGSASNILDGEYVIGVWASASRPKITTLSSTGDKPTYSSDYVQVSRLGMPLTNEAIIPIGLKDKWNATTPYDAAELSFAPNFTNPELALYMDDSQFGTAVPALSALRIQTNSLGSFDFRNGKDGLANLPDNAKTGTVFADPTYGPILLQKGNPRSVDILPIFFTGVPNLPPYQLATTKNGNPLAAGKPFINNFLPSLGDMLRLNMAVPPTPRTSANFSSEGLLAAAVAGLTDPAYANPNIEAIPNMDGFPNGRRLEDDVTRIELQAVSGVVLAAVGLWYDDYQTGGSPVTPKLLGVLGYTAGPDSNDMPFRNSFPYLAPPHRGYDYVKKLTTSAVRGDESGSVLNLGAPTGFFTGQNTPNPVATSTSLAFHLNAHGNVTVTIYSVDGKPVATILDRNLVNGDYKATWAPGADVPQGMYVATLNLNGQTIGSTKIAVAR
ncbi:MAG: DUF4331 family protein [Bacteroidota bacterium]